MLETDYHLQTMTIEEQQMVAEPVEGFKEILLDNFKPERTTRLAPSPIHQSVSPSSTHDIPKRK